jgi:pantothenate kinase type III
MAVNFNSPGTWGVISPAAAVTNLIAVLSDPSLQLTSGQISSLTDKLQNALASIQQGLNKQAINQLSAFIKSVTASLKTGKISLHAATTLIDAASAIMAEL